MKEQKFTENGKRYWNDEGAYNEEYKRLHEEMVPHSGRSESYQGEVIRAVSRMYYEYYNNGNCNACQEIPSKPYWEMEDEDDMEYDTVVSDFYQGFIDIIYYYFCRRENEEGIKTIKEIERQIPDTDLSEPMMSLYERLVDIAVFEVMNDNERWDIPEWYKN